MTSRNAFTVIIPAHNEEAVIERCLATLLSDAPEDAAMDVIVAANGCEDRTVELARKAAGSRALILDLPEGSKTRAMNAANARSLYFPRIYLDADVQCSYRSVAALAEVLRDGGTMAASPALRMDLSRSNFLVKAYYRVWLTQPYATDAMVGSGCFGLSEAAYRRIGDFPDIIGDDIWVHSRFAESERRNISRDSAGRKVFFTVSPPRRALDQIRVEGRRRIGNEQVLRQYPSSVPRGSNRPGDLRKALSAGASPVDIAIYLTMKALARLRAHIAKRQQGGVVWERDLAAREV